MTTIPAPTSPPLQFTSADRPPPEFVAVAELDGEPLLIDQNTPAQVLLDFLDQVQVEGDLVASHAFVRDALGDQYVKVKAFGLTGPQWNELGATIVAVLTGQLRLPIYVPDVPAADELGSDDE